MFISAHPAAQVLQYQMIEWSFIYMSRCPIMFKPIYQQEKTPLLQILIFFLLKNNLGAGLFPWAMQGCSPATL